MTAQKKSSETRHGRLAEGRTQTSITISKDLLNKARAEAKKEGRSFSNWLERYLQKLNLAIAAVAVFCSGPPFPW